MKIQLIKKKRPFALVAMADIAFLLLIFLILTISVDENGEITLPHFLYSKKTSFPDTITIEIQSNDSIIIENQSCTTATIDSILVNFKSQNTYTVRILADSSVEYSTIDLVLNSLKENEFYRVLLMTEKKE